MRLPQSGRAVLDPPRAYRFDAVEPEPLPEVPHHEPLKVSTRRPAAAQVTSKATERPDGVSLQVQAPTAARKGRDVVSFVCATTAPMPSMFGTIQLAISPDAVDLGRLRSGLLPLVADHDPAGKLVGRILSADFTETTLRMTAEWGTTPIAVAVRGEVDDGVRSGASPGFLVKTARVLKEGDRGYNKRQLMQLVVTSYEIFEASLTAIPRNPNARVHGRLSMTTDTTLGAPELVNTSDLFGLQIAVVRKALDGDCPEPRRTQLSAFITDYDKRRAAGQDEEAAALAAVEAMGL